MANDRVGIRITINGDEKTVDIPAGISALTLVRDILGLKGAKEGCGIGECGACTIVVDGKAVNACLMFAAQLDGRDVKTVEGLGQDEELDPIQEAFVEKNAVQCGYCTPGLLMSTHALLQQTQNPDEQTIRRAVAGNLCRCTGYQSILAAVADAAQRLQNQKEE